VEEGMIVRIKIGQKMIGVDVLDEKCPSRPCFQFGFNKGTFVQGRGYTSYYDKERPVCMRRHLHGCPTNSVCPKCRTLTVHDPGSLCAWCKEALTEPVPSPAGR